MNLPPKAAVTDVFEGADTCVGLALGNACLVFEGAPCVRTLVDFDCLPLNLTARDVGDELEAALAKSQANSADGARMERAAPLAPAKSSSNSAKSARIELLAVPSETFGISAALAFFFLPAVFLQARRARAMVESRRSSTTKEQQPRS